MNLLIRILRRIRRGLIYVAVLRPCFLIAVVIVYLPLTAIGDWVSGNSMLANLFVDYDFKKAFWFAFALSGAVWALMLTTCLTLDFARDRQDQQHLERPWLPDPPQPESLGSRFLFRMKDSLLVVYIARPSGGIYCRPESHSAHYHLRGLPRYALQASSSEGCFPTS